MLCCLEAAPIPFISRTVALVSFPRAAAGCIALVPLSFGFFGFLYTNLLLIRPQSQYQTVGCVDLQVKEMRQGIQAQICCCCYLRAFEKLTGMQGDGRVIVGEEWYEFPYTGPDGVAIFRFALARIILARNTTKRSLRLGYSIS